MINKIAFSGKICSGKTTIAQMLSHDYGYKRASFASPMKELAKIYFNTHSDVDACIKIHKFAEKTFADRVNPAMFVAWFINLTKGYDKSRIRDEKTDIVRKFLQELGTKSRQDFYQDIWVDALLKSIKGLNKVVIDDLRYKNEYDALLDNGFLVIRFEIDPDVQKQRIKELYGDISEERLNHPSETDLDDIDFSYVVSSSGTVFDQYESVLDIMQSL